MQPKTLLLPLLAAVLCAGCASTVRVRTEPASGARIYYRGDGRPTFRWTAAPGGSPATFEVYYSSLSLWAYWPETGVQTRIESIPLSNWRDPDEVVLRADPSLPRVGASAGSDVDPSKVAVRPSAYRSESAFDRRSVRKDVPLATLPEPKLELPPPAAED